MIVADAGKERDAERIATAVGGAWVEMPEGSPANFDLNDFHQQVGSLEAVAELLAQAREPHPEALPNYANLADLDTNPPQPRRWVIDEMAPAEPWSHCSAAAASASRGDPASGNVHRQRCRDLRRDRREGSGTGLSLRGRQRGTRRRQVAIPGATGRSPVYSADGLHLEGRAGQENVLVTFGADRLLLPGPFPGVVERECARVGRRR